MVFPFPTAARQVLFLTLHLGFCICLFCLRMLQIGVNCCVLSRDFGLFPKLVVKGGYISMK